MNPSRQPTLTRESDGSERGPHSAGRMESARRSWICGTEAVVVSRECRVAGGSLLSLSLCSRLFCSPPLLLLSASSVRSQPTPHRIPESPASRRPLAVAAACHAGCVSSVKRLKCVWTQLEDPSEQLRATESDPPALALTTTPGCSAMARNEKERNSHADARVWCRVTCCLRASRLQSAAAAPPSPPTLCRSKANAQPRPTRLKNNTTAQGRTWQKKLIGVKKWGAGSGKIRCAGLACRQAFCSSPRLDWLRSPRQWTGVHSPRRAAPLLIALSSSVPSRSLRSRAARG